MKKVLAVLSIIPSMVEAVFLWIISLPVMLWKIPRDNFYFIAYHKVLAKVRKNDDGTYTIFYNGRQKTFTEEEYRAKFGNTDDLK